MLFSQADTVSGTEETGRGREERESERERERERESVDARWSLGGMFTQELAFSFREAFGASSALYCLVG